MWRAAHGRDFVAVRVTPTGFRWDGRISKGSETMVGMCIGSGGRRLLLARLWIVEASPHGRSRTRLRRVLIRTARVGVLNMVP
jgi:hypothetical protein